MDQPTAVVCDLGGTKLAVAEVDTRGEILWRREERVRGLAPAAIMERVVAVIADAVAASPNAATVGVAAAAMIDARTGDYRYPSRTGPGDVASLTYTDFPLSQRVAESTGLPAFVENDGDAAALAEWKVGAARGYDNVVVLTIGTGVGTGVVNRGELYRRRWGGPQLGGTVAKIGGKAYVMGQVASGTGIEIIAKDVARRHPTSSFARDLATAPVTGEAVAGLAASGDLLARRILSLVSRRVGELVTNAINIFDPEVVVLGGGAMRALDIEIVRHTHRRQVLPSGGTPARIVAAQLGVNAGLTGAAVGAFDGAGIALSPGAAGRNSPALG